MKNVNYSKFLITNTEDYNCKDRMLIELYEDDLIELKDDIDYLLEKRYFKKDKVAKQMETIKIKYHNPDLIKIEKIEVGDWIDLRAAENIKLSAGEFKLINLGISMKLPEGYEAHVVPRSSTFKTWGVLQTNSMGVIDNSYSGTNDIWRFPAYAIRDTEIKVNDRLCQFRIMKKQPKVELIEVDKLDDTDRGGFGSTGIQ